MTTNGDVIKLSDSKPALQAIKDRLGWIERRRIEISRIMSELTAESNNLYREAEELMVAQDTLRKLYAKA